MKYLFIGGLLDGQWIDTDGQQIWTVALPTTFYSPPDPERVGRTQKYRKEERRWGERGKESGVVFYVLERMETAEIFSRLLGNYRPGTPVAYPEASDYRMPEGERKKLYDFLEAGGDMNKAVLLLPPVWRER